MWIVTLFFSLILVAVLQMWIFSRFGFKRLTYRRWFTPTVVNEGDTVTMSETIRHDTLLPLPWVRRGLRHGTGDASDLLSGRRAAVSPQYLLPWALFHRYAAA